MTRPRDRRSRLLRMEQFVGLYPDICHLGLKHGAFVQRGRLKGAAAQMLQMMSKSSGMLQAVAET